MTQQSHIVDLRGCRVDLRTRRIAFDDGRTASLTGREATLLAYMAQRPGQVVSRAELLQDVWGYAPQVVSRTADGTMSRLRDKVEADPANPVHLLTIHGEGYRFETGLTPLTRPDAAPAAPQVWFLGPVRVDLDRLVVERADTRASLKATEAGILRALIEAEGAVLTRDDLAAAAGLRGARTVDNLVRSLRTRLEADPSSPEHLLTVRGHGYRLHRSPGPPESQVALVLTEVRGLERTRATDAAEVDRRLATVDRAGFPLPGVGQLGMAFHSPDEALAWTLAAQVALDGGPGVAMALHAGQDHLTTGARGELRYQGPVAALTQRLLRAAHEGQIWVTDATWQAASPALRRRFDAADLGPSTSIGHTWALVPAELDRPLPSRRARATLVDAESTTSFVGRHTELSALGDWLREGLGPLTVRGPGGVGKTRLVSRFAAGLATAWWCDLAAASSGEQAIASVATVLGLRRPDPERIARVLQGRGGVVILDNVEQIPDFAAVFAPLIEATPDVRWLATSRRSTGLAGERVLELGPLSAEAARLLFEDRSPRGSEDADAVAQLVDRLDRLPLAIELAASRTRLMSPEALLGRLPSATSLPDMRAVLEWSWTLLSDWERQALAQLSVFRGRFHAADAEAVVVLSPDSPEVLDVLERLHAQSMIRVHETRAGRRLSLLQALREYAGEHRSDDVDERHAERMAWYGQDAQLTATWRGPRITALAAVVDLLPDLEAAARWSLDRDRGERAAYALIAMARGRRATTRNYRDVIRLLDPLVDTLGAAPCRGRALALLSVAHRWNGDLGASEARARQAVAIGPDCELTWRALGHVLVDLRRYADAVDAFERALSVNDDPALAAIGRGDQAHALMIMGRLEQALDLVRRAERELQGVGNAWELAYLQRLHGHALRQLGRFRQARALFEAALPTFQEMADIHALGETHLAIGVILDDDGDLDGAAHHMERSAECFLDTGVTGRAAVALAGLGTLAYRRGEFERASLLSRRALAIPGATDEERAYAAINLLEGAVDAGRFDDAIALLPSLSVPDMPASFQAIAGCHTVQIALARDLPVDLELLEPALLPDAGEIERVRATCLLGQVALRDGDREAARRHLAQAEQIAGAERGGARGRAIEALRQAL